MIFYETLFISRLEQVTEITVSNLTSHSRTDLHYKGAFQSTVYLF
jgi:hypothetical protein